MCYVKKAIFDKGFTIKQSLVNNGSFSYGEDILQCAQCVIAANMLNVVTHLTKYIYMHKLQVQ